MGRLDQEKIWTAWHQLEKIKVFNIEDLTSLLTCSVPNARLKLRQWQAYTSYIKTLPFPGMAI
jgi:MarR-like DNA-binding transcriptional regulator SgrR of sgrS sRNA